MIELASDTNVPFGGTFFYTPTIQTMALKNADYKINTFPSLYAVSSLFEYPLAMAYLVFLGRKIIKDILYLYLY